MKITVVNKETKQIELGPDLDVQYLDYKVEGDKKVEYTFLIGIGMPYSVDVRENYLNYNGDWIDDKGVVSDNKARQLERLISQ